MPATADAVLPIITPGSGYWSARVAHTQKPATRREACAGHGGVLRVMSGR